MQTLVRDNFIFAFLLFFLPSVGAHVLRDACSIGVSEEAILAEAIISAVGCADRWQDRFQAGRLGADTADALLPNFFRSARLGLGRPNLFGEAHDNYDVKVLLGGRKRKTFENVMKQKNEWSL